MKTSLKIWMETHKTQIMISCAVLGVLAKSLSIAGTTTTDVYSQPQHMNGQMANGQAQPQQQSRGFWGNLFGGGDEQVSQNAAYTNDGGQTGYYGNSGYAGYTGSNASLPANQPMADYTSGYYNQQAAYDRTNENYSDYMRDQQNYDDAYGNTYKLNSGYSNTYVNNTTGEYVQSDDANYDPNQYSTSSWESVTPSSSYSSSSYSSYSSSSEE